MTRQKTNAAISDLKAGLIKNFGSEIELVLFGSAATGKYANESDIDVLVLLPVEPDNDMEEKIFYTAFEIELKHSVVFGIIVYSKEFWNSALASAMPLHENIQREGVRV